MSYSELRKQRISSNKYPDETYALNGINLSTPDPLIKNREASVAQDCRMFAREQDDKRVAIKTRKGPGFYSVPIGESINQQQTSTTGATDQSFSKSAWLAQSFTPNTNGRMTLVELNLKKNTGTGTVIAALYSNSGGLPSQLIATSGTPGSSITSSYAYVKFRFIEAPQLTSGTQYWIVLYAQDDAVNTYHASSTTAATTAATSTTGAVWTSASFALNFKVSISTDSPVLGATRRYAENGTKETLFAHGTSVYKVTDSDGTTTAIKTGLSALATKYRFDSFNDKNIFVNGNDGAYQYNGSTVTSLTTPQTPSHVCSHKGRLFFVAASSPTRVFYSELQDETTYPGVNFFYVPSPKSPDPITALVVFQDSLIIFTKETKYVLSGYDVSSFSLRQAIGTKGAVSQEAVWADRNYVYYISEDGPYRWNGSTDEYLGDKIQPEFDAIPDKTKCTVALWNNQWRIYYQDSGSSVNNRMFLYDLIYEQWFTDSNSYISNTVVLTQDSGNPLLEFSNLVGAGYYAEQNYSNLGAPLDFKYWTAYNKYLSGSSKDRIKTFRPIIRPSGYTYIMQIGKDIDFQNKPDMRNYTVATTGATWGGGYTWGASSVNPAEWGSSTITDNKTGMSGRGKHTQYRFERYGANTPVELYGYIAIIKSSRIK